MQKWEYLEIQRPNKDKLAALGNEGWELVSVTCNEFGDSNHFYFKRPKN